jgi:sporulation protein YlmC with PRC-barrel domain
MDGARQLWAHLHLLDRQLVDRDGRLCGNVDDLELEERDGTLWVTGLRTGAGSLARRLGATVLGRWLDQVHRGVDPEHADHTLIPLRHVADIGGHVALSLDHTEVATWHGERWVADHVISHIPGSRHATDE